MRIYVLLCDNSRLLRLENGQRAVFLKRKDAETRKRKLLKMGVSRGFVTIEAIDLKHARRST